MLKSFEKCGRWLGSRVSDAKECLLQPKVRFRTGGFTAFILYQQVTLVLVMLAISPAIIIYLSASPILGSQVYTPLKVFSRRQWKEGERIRRGKFFRLPTPQEREVLAYLHTSLTNMLFFTFFIYGVLRLAHCCGIRQGHPTLAMSALTALIPTAALYVCGVVYHYASRLFRASEPLPWRYQLKVWRTQEKTRDYMEDSSLNLMFREQNADSMSMKSLARLDRQMLFGIPTAIVAAACYIRDVCEGKELQKAEELREEARSSITGVSTNHVYGLGLKSI